MEAREWKPGDSRVLPDVPESAYPPGAVPLEPPREKTLTELAEQLDAIERTLT